MGGLKAFNDDADNDIMMMVMMMLTNMMMMTPTTMMIIMIMMIRMSLTLMVVFLNMRNRCVSYLQLLKLLIYSLHQAHF